MRWTRRTFQILAAGGVVAVWAVFYVVVITTAPLAYDPVTESAAKVNREFALVLAVPAALWVVAALLVVSHWWARHGVHLAQTDPPGRLLAVALLLLPEPRSEWGAAMTAELAEVRGRSARWRFALSTAWAALWAPRPGGWPVRAMATGAVIVLVAATPSALGVAAPGIDLFAVTFAALVGVLAVLVVVRPRPLRLQVPNLLVTAGVAAAITMTVVFLRHDPTAADHVSSTGELILAVILAGCLWIAVATPRPLRTHRFAPRFGVGVAVVYVVGFLLLIRAVYDPRIARGIGDPATVPAGEQQIAGVATAWLFMGLAVACLLAALLVGLIDRSFHSGLQAGIWAVIAMLPLTFAVWLNEALRLYPVNGGLLFFGDGAPEGENLSAGVTFILGILPAASLPFAAIGAALAARLTRRAATRAQLGPNGR